MSEVLIPLGPADAGEMQALHAPLFDSPWTVEGIADQLGGPGVGALGLGAAALDGFVLFRRAADESEILIIAVSPSARRRGLGRRLMDGALRAVAAAGAESMFLEVAVDNAPALALYASLGFEEIARRPRYYHRRGGLRVDALLLRRSLASAAA